MIDYLMNYPTQQIIQHNRLSNTTDYPTQQIQHNRLSNTTDYPTQSNIKHRLSNAIDYPNHRKADYNAKHMHTMNKWVAITPTHHFARVCG